MRILVCGGRDYTNRDRVFAVLNSYLLMCDNLHIISGGTKGADTLAEEWFESQRGVTTKPLQLSIYPANWELYGKSAGPIRNQEMLEQRPDWVIAFPGGRGTAHMVKIAKEAKVRVFEVPEYETLR